MLTKKSKKKKPYQTIIFSIIIGLLTVMAIGFLVVSNWRINQRRAELTSRIESLKKEIQVLDEKNSELKAGINQSQGAEYLEKTAREDFNLKKPGEEVVVVKPAEGGEGTVAKEKNFWEKLLEKLHF